MTTDQQEKHREVARNTCRGVSPIVAIDDLVAKFDDGGCRHRTTGTHEKAFMGIPPTGEEIEVDGNAMYRTEDGSVAEKLTVGDTLGLIRQLGAIPESPPV